MSTEAYTIEDQILACLKRRPMNLQELVSGISTSANELEHRLGKMEQDRLVERANSNDWKIVHK